MAVAANSGWYMLPDLDLGYPEGMAGLDLDESGLRRYLGRRLTILLGAANTDSTAADLPRMEAAMAQGPHRFARGRDTFGHSASDSAAQAGAALSAGRPRRGAGSRTRQPGDLRSRGAAILAG